MLNISAEPKQEKNQYIEAQTNWSHPTFKTRKLKQIAAKKKRQ